MHPQTQLPVIFHNTCSAITVHPSIAIKAFSRGYYPSKIDPAPSEGWETAFLWKCTVFIVEVLVKTARCVVSFLLGRCNGTTYGKHCGLAWRIIFLMFQPCLMTRVSHEQIPFKLRIPPLIPLTFHDPIYMLWVDNIPLFYKRINLNCHDCLIATWYDYPWIYKITIGSKLKSWFVSMRVSYTCASSRGWITNSRKTGAAIVAYFKIMDPLSPSAYLK